jgi:hypothetical protein
MVRAPGFETDRDGAAASIGERAPDGDIDGRDIAS